MLRPFAPHRRTALSRAAAALLGAMVGAVLGPTAAFAAEPGFVVQHSAIIFLTDPTQSSLTAQQRAAVFAGLGNPAPENVTLSIVSAGRNDLAGRFNYGGLLTRRTLGVSGGNYTSARFNVPGDLVLATEEKIFAFGSNLLTLQVANNATLQQGSVINLSAFGNLAGAGGGAGGLAAAPRTDLTPAVESFNGVPFQGVTPVPLGGIGARRAGDSGGSGGVGGYRRMYAPPQSFAALAGGHGQTGMGDYLSSGGRGAAGGVMGEFFPAPAAQGAAGGAGGTVFAAAGRGQNGANGVMGPTGQQGGSGTGVLPGFDVVARSLRGGSGGGAGSTGGHGYAGQDGGAGGGGGASPASGLACPFGGCISDFGAGGTGGASGAGGYGGAGGVAGHGGAGGGGIELVVRGNLAVQGASFRAAGADGGLGQAGAAGQAGTAGGAGQVPTRSAQGQLGGTGGDGGHGGTGGTGGTGGHGGAGSGGSIFLMAAGLNMGGGSLVKVSGGGTNGTHGDFATQAHSGPNRGNAQLDSSPLLGANPYASFASQASAFTPNIIGLRGGAEAHGILESTARYTALTQPNTPPPRNAVAVVERFGTDVVRWTGNLGRTEVPMDQLMVTALRDMKAPALAAVSALDTGAGAQIPGAPVRLQTRGYLANPEFTAGGAGFTNLTTLQRTESFVTLVDRSTEAGAQKTYALQAAFTPYGVERVFKGNGNGALYVTDNGLLRAQVGLGTTATGLVQIHNSTSEVNRSVSDFVNQARVGGSTRIQFTGSNAGNADSLMSGNLSVTSNVRGTLATDVYALRDAATATSIERTSASATVALNGARGQTERIVATFTNTFDDQGTTAWRYTYDVQYVGPLPSVNLPRSAAGEFTLDFGTLVLGQSLQRQFTFANLAQAANSLTDLDNLNLLSYTLTGGDAGQFSIDHALAGALLEPGTSATRTLSFTPTAAGAYSAVYRIITDANADLGVAGDIFTFHLTGQAVAAVPEPSQWGMFGLGCIVLGLAKARQRAKRAA